ncbi:MAG: hypothetical protein V3S37_02140 [Dehalococcoidia bacterium]
MGSLAHGPLVRSMARGAGHNRPLPLRPLGMEKMEMTKWKCPSCGKVVVYDNDSPPPTDGTTYCSKTLEHVQMERVGK